MHAAISVDTISSVAVVRMNRPEVMNAISRPMLETLNEELLRLGRDRSVRAVVLTGDNGSFSTGEDLRHGAKMSPTEFGQMVDLFQEVTRNLRAMPQPVVAAVDGFAFGGGLEIAAACDLRIATEGTKFCCPEVNIGQVISNGASSLLPRIVGEGRAREIVFTGEVFDAARAWEIGFVSRVVEKSALLKVALDLAHRLASRAPESIRLSKRLLNAPLDAEIESALDREAQSVVEAFSTADGQEGMRAFIEKRAPQFSGD